MFVTRAECANPYPEVELLIEETGCLNWGISRVYRSAVLATVVLFSFYVKYLVYAGLYIEKERMKRQKIQLNRYFMSQKNGIVVMKEKCVENEDGNIIFSNKSFENLTGLVSEREQDLFKLKQFKIARQIKEGSQADEFADEESSLLVSTDQMVSLWEIYQTLLARENSAEDQEPLTITVQ